MQQHNDAMLELAALYALGGLDRNERATIEAHAASCEECRSAMASGFAAAYALLASFAEQPPVALRDRLLSITGARPPAPAPLRRPIWTQPGWLAAAAAAVVLVFAGTWAFETNRLGLRSWAAGCPPSTAPCTVSGRVVATGPSALRLEAHGLRALPVGKVYQAWFIRPGAAPTPAPTFQPDASGNATVVLPIGAEKGLTVAVTVEPDGGSKAPTTKPFLIASIQ